MVARLSSTHLVWPILIALLIVAQRAHRLDDPLFGRNDHRMNESAAIARNFHEEGLDILHPRIDWRGAGPGFIEETFQAYTFCVALLYEVTGPDEAVGRGFSLALYVLTGLMLYGLALRIATPRAAAFSMLFFGLAPMGLYYGSSFQPDSLGLFLCVATLSTFWRWCDSGRWTTLAICCAALSVCSMMKPTNLFLGAPLAYLAWQRFGWTFLRRADMWLFATIPLGLTAAHFANAHTIWEQYGSTMGIWGQGFSKFGLPDVNFGLTIVDRLMIRVVTPAGLVLFVLGVLHRPRAASGFVHWWVLGAALVTLATSGGQMPHDYYQLAWLPPLVLYMGLGADHLATRRAVEGMWCDRPGSRLFPVVALTLLVVAGSLWASRQYYRVVINPPTLPRFAAEVRKVTDEGALVVVAGIPKALLEHEPERRREPDGVRLGFDPVELYQSHRKGWFVHSNRLTASVLDNLKSKGARYLISLYPEVLSRRRLDEALRGAKVLSRDAAWIIYDLRGE